MVLKYYLPGFVNTGRLLISEIGYVRGIMLAAAPPSWRLCAESWYMAHA
jgi:hypothetical protein